jgi:hypothetical protein
MKKVLLTSLTICFLAVTLVAQSVDYTQHTLVSKRTASWCSNCGNWGWDAFEGILSDFDDSNTAIGVAVHSSTSDYTNEVTEYFMQHIGTGAQPVFYHGKTNLGLSRNNGAAKRQELLDIANTAAATDSPVGLGVDASVAGDEVTVSVAYGTDNGSYRLGVYLLDNNLVGFQSTRGNDAVHKRMLVGYMTPSVEGDLLTDTDGTATYTASVSDLGISAIENYEVLVVAWEVSSGLVFANGRVVDIEQGAVNTTQVEIADLKYLINDTNIDVSWSSNDIRQVDLIDQSGRLVQSVQVSGQQAQLDTPDQNGIYILSLYTSQGLVSEQISIVK